MLLKGAKVSGVQLYVTSLREESYMLVSSSMSIKTDSHGIFHRGLGWIIRVITGIS